MEANRRRSRIAIRAAIVVGLLLALYLLGFMVAVQLKTLKTTKSDW